jgi:hypothetical protein
LLLLVQAQGHNFKELDIPEIVKLIKQHSAGIKTCEGKDVVFLLG